MKKILTLILVTTPFLFSTNLNSCTGCHGSNFEKVALGTSKVVKDMSITEIESTLKGYRDRTYGRAMKSIMKKAVISLTDKDIEEMAKEIKK